MLHLVDTHQNEARVTTYNQQIVARRMGPSPLLSATVLKTSPPGHTHLVQYILLCCFIFQLTACVKMLRMAMYLALIN